MILLTPNLNSGLTTDERLAPLRRQAGAPSSVDIASQLGRSWIRSKVAPGGAVPGTSGERAEVYWPTRAKSGEEWWMEYTLIIPENFSPNPNTAWNTIQQFHHDDNYNVVPVALTIWTPAGDHKLMLEMRGGDRAAASDPNNTNRRVYRVMALEELERGVPHRILIHARWSDQSDGEFSLSVNDTWRVSDVGPNMYVGDEGNFPKWGYYRGLGTTTERLFYSAPKIATTYWEAVA